LSVFRCRLSVQKFTKFGQFCLPSFVYLSVAESIRIVFDPAVISYGQLLELFFEMHTPADPRWAGTQYRSAIFVHTPEQRILAEQAVRVRGALGRFVAVEDSSDFYAAEEYHQKYLEKMTGMRRNIMDASEESFWM